MDIVGRGHRGDISGQIKELEANYWRGFPFEGRGAVERVCQTSDTQADYYQRD